jgi:hypothetical protein
LTPHAALSVCRIPRRAAHICRDLDEMMKGTMMPELKWLDKPMGIRQRASKTAPPHLGPQEINDLALALAAGRLYCASDVPKDILPVVFLPLCTGGVLDDYDLDTVGNVVEDLSKAHELAVNGYPIFTTCRVIHKDDWDAVIVRYRKIVEIANDLAK